MRVRGASGWPLPLPTRRAAGLVAACAVPVAVAAWWEPAAWLGLAGVVAAGAAVVADFLAAPRAGDLECERVGTGVLPLGSETDVPLALSSRSGGAVRVTATADDLHAGIVRVAEPGAVVVPAQGTVVVATRVRPMERGRIALGAAHVRVAGPMGLSDREIRFDVGCEVRVLPGLRSAADAVRALRRGRREAGRRHARRRGEGTSFESLRDYVQGDDPRKLDWKASARHARLITRQFEVERSRTVILAVDCGRWMTGDVGGLTRLDRVLDACVTLAHVASLRDDRVGLVAFSDRTEAVVPPVKGRAAVQRILDATLDVRPRLVESDYERAFAELALRHRKRSLLVLFTDVLSPDASKIVADELRRQARRHATLVVALRDTGLASVADAVPANASASYEQAAAEELLLEREAALARMRHDGLHVLDADPRDLGPALVERYLDLKARLVV